MGQYIGLHIIVQSNHKDPEYLNSRIELYLLDFYQELTNPEYPTYITDESLNHFKDATMKTFLEKSKNLSEESKRYMEEIRLNTYLFNRRNKLATYLNSLINIRQELIQFVENYVMNKVLRKKFSSYFYGNKTFYPNEYSKEDNIEIINDPILFKRKSMLLPSVTYDSHFNTIL